MEPLAVLGLLAVIIGIVGLVVLLKSRKTTFAEFVRRTSWFGTQTGGTI